MMSFKPDQRKPQDENVKDQGAKFCNNTKIQNGAQSKNFSINNNVEDSDNRCHFLHDRTNSLSNGVLRSEAHSSRCCASDQLKYMFTAHTNFTRNTNNSCSTSTESVSNHVCNSVPVNSTSNNLTCTSVPISPEPLPGCSSSSQSSISVEDTDLRNNVDYVTRIEKCPPKVSCSSDSSPDADKASSSTLYSNCCTLNDIGSNIGSTSHGTCILRPNINSYSARDPIAGPSGLVMRARERRDSSSGNEGDQSDSEDYCIYTYKGNDDAVMAQQIDQVVENREVEAHKSGKSSPEMDFLEMDFDPGPSCEQDTGDSDLASINEDIQNIAMDNAEVEPVLNDLSSGKVMSRQTNSQLPQKSPESDARNVTSHEKNDTEEQDEEPSCSVNRVPKTVYPSTSWQLSPTSSIPTKSWESTSIHRHGECPLRQSFGYHSTSGDLISPGDNRDANPELWAENSSASGAEHSNLNSSKINLSSNLYHRMMAKKLMLNKQAAFNQSSDSNLEFEICDERLDSLSSVEKVMLWTEQEAIAKQVTQIKTSACGATAAINALHALKVPFVMDILIKGVATRAREHGAPLPRYLVSRSLAGATHRGIARGISLATNDTVITKFFAFYPERKVSLSHWLQYWISRGAAPIATLNLQHCGEGQDIPDAWHHQMIFGVSQNGIYLTNPLQCVPEKILWHQLVSPSVLLIRKDDVLAHWNPTTDLTPLMHVNYKWRKLNVLGQVVNIVREAVHGDETPGITHIRIPASYEAGITLVIHANSPAASELLNAEELPLL